MHITSLNAAEQAGQVEPDGDAERYVLVSAAVCGAQGGQVSMLVVAKDRTHVLRSVGQESAAVVVSGEGTTMDGRIVVAGTVLQFGPGSAIELRTGESGLTLLILAGNPTSPTPVEATTRAFEVDDVQDREIHDPELGFFHMRARILVGAEQGGARSLLLALATFAPTDGCHALHRHPEAEEIFYVWAGDGVHLSGDGGRHPMTAGDLVYVPKGEPHGFLNTGSVPLRALFGYLGADTLEGAGYEVLPPAGASPNE